MPLCFRKRRFYLRILHFGCATAFGFGNLQFHVLNAVKLRNYAIWFQKMSFLPQTAVSISESGLYFESHVAAVCHHKRSASSRILYCRYSTQYSHLVMAALRSRCGHYIFALSSIFFYLFFPRLISAATDWMSTILLHMAWP